MFRMPRMPQMPQLPQLPYGPQSYFPARLPERQLQTALGTEAGAGAATATTTATTGRSGTTSHTLSPALSPAWQQQHPHQRQRQNQQQQILASWIIAEEEDARDRSDPERIWQLFQTNSFAALWYAARDAGEHLRAKALHQLYSQRTTPGGTHPDPRKPAAFSPRATLNAAAAVLGVSIWQVPESDANQADRLSAQHGYHKPQLAWIATYPQRNAPDIAVRVTTRARQQEFDVACLLGYIAKEYHRIADPDAPAGLTLLPTDPGIVTILHQFAIGLLALDEHCPAGWLCTCNALRGTFNAPPPDHERPTDQFAISQLQDYAARLRATHTSEPIARTPHVEAWDYTGQNDDGVDHDDDDDAFDRQDTQQQPTIGSGPLTPEGT